MRLLMLHLPMNSSINITPTASHMKPVVINRDSEPTQHPIVTEQQLAEILNAFYWATQTISKREAYRIYRLNCKQTKCRPVAASTFCRRLSGYHRNYAHLMRGSDQAAQVGRHNNGGAAS
jgi:hypothetical protein